MATLIATADGNLTGSTTFAAAETGALAIVLNRNTTTAIAAATTVTSTTFTVTTSRVIDGALLWLKQTAVGSTGTFKVDLQKSAVSQASVTVNKADLPDSTNAIAEPVFFKFTGTATGDGAATWTLVLTTTGTQTITANIASATATNFTRALRTTTTATPAAADDLYIVGELTGAGTHNSRTVTMDSTAATAYGNGALNSTTVAGGGIHVSNYGTLTYGTTASTAYILRVNGDLMVYQFGALNIISPQTSTTQVLEFQQASADGDFGLRCLDNSTITITGQPRTAGKAVVKCKLTSNLASAGTTLNVDTNTGWLSGDVVCVASTTRTVSDCETVTLSANAGASSFTASAAVVAHSGTTPTQAEVGLITRNVKIRSTSTTLMSYVYCTALSTVTASWAEFYYVGATTANKRGIEIDGGAVTNPKSFTWCSLHDLDNFGLYCNANNVTSLNVTFSNNVGWLSSAGVFIGIIGPVTNTDWTFDSNLVMRTASSGISLLDVGGTCTNNTVVGANTNYGFVLNENVSTLGTFNNNTSHSNNSGLFIANTNGYAGTIGNFTTWRNLGAGVVCSCGTSADLLFGNLLSFGSGSTTQGNFNLSGGDCINITGGILAGDTSFTSQVGFNLAVVFNIVQFNLNNVDMSGSTSIYAPHTTNDFLGNSNLNVWRGTANNCKFGATNVFSTKTNWSKSSWLSFEKYNQTAGDHRTEMTFGQLRTDSAIYNTAAPSMKMTPNNAGNKLENAPQARGIQVAVNNGDTVTASVWVRKDATYTGAQPRLIVRANVAIGINADTVLATYSAGTGSWNQVSGTTAAVTDDGTVELIVDCDGTAGFINVDDWSIITGGKTSTNDMSNWFNGLPATGTEGGAAGGGAYFSAGFV